MTCTACEAAGALCRPHSIEKNAERNALLLEMRGAGLSTHSIARRVGLSRRRVRRLFEHARAAREGG